MILINDDACVMMIDDDDDDYNYDRKCYIYTIEYI